MDEAGKMKYKTNVIELGRGYSKSVCRITCINLRTPAYIVDKYRVEFGKEVYLTIPDYT